MYSSTLPLISALDGGGWSMPSPGRFTPGKDTVPIVQEAGWAPGSVWTGGNSRHDRDLLILLNYNFIDPSVHKYNGCMEDISVTYC